MIPNQNAGIANPGTQQTPPSIIERLKERNIGHVCVTGDLLQKAKDYQSRGLFFGIVPVKGDSMTSNDPNRCIPDGARIFIGDLGPITDLFWTRDVPIRKSVAIYIENKEGKGGFFCKEISFIDYINNTVVLSSYNPKYPPAHIPFSNIKRMFNIDHIFTSPEDAPVIPLSSQNSPQ